MFQVPVGCTLSFPCSPLALCSLVMRIALLRRSWGECVRVVGFVLVSVVHVGIVAGRWQHNRAWTDALCVGRNPN